MPRRYLFHDCELLPHPPYLLRNGEPVAISAQVLALLRLLLERSGQVVSKADLLGEVWGHNHLTDAALARAVMRTRRAIGDDGQEQRLIRTVHGRGIMFVAPVECIETDDQTVSPAPTPALVREAGPAGNADFEPALRATPVLRWIPAGVLVAALLLAAVVFVTMWWTGRATPAAATSPPGAERLLLLRDVVLAEADPELELLAAALPDLLAERLVRHGIRLLQASSFDDTTSEEEWRQGDARLAGLFGAPRAIELTLSRDAGGVQADLVLRDAEATIAGSVEGSASDVVVALADTLSRQVSGLPIEDGAVSRRVDPLLEDLVLRARVAWVQGDVQAALKSLDAALALEPDNARLLLLRLEMQLADGGAPADLSRRLIALLDRPSLALSALERAMILQRAGVHAWYAGDAAQAVLLLQRSLRLAQGQDAPVTIALARNALSMALQSRGESEQAWEHARLAVQDLRRADHPYHLAQALTNLGYLAEDRGLLDSARRWQTEALGIRESFGFARQISASQYALARVLRRSGELARAAELAARAATQMAQAGQTMEQTSALEEQAVIATLRGRHDDADAFLDQAMLIATQRDDRLGLAWLQDARGRLRLAQGRTAEAVDHLRRSLASQTAEGELNEARYCQIGLLDGLWRLQAAGADTQQEANALHAALSTDADQLAHDQRVALEVVRLRRSIAQNDLESGLALCESALGLARASGAVDHEAEAGFECAGLRQRLGDAKGAQRMLSLAEGWNREWFATRIALDQPESETSSGPGTSPPGRSR